MRAGLTHTVSFVAGMVVATAIAADAVPTPRSPKRDRYQALDTLAQSISYIVNSYVDRVDERALMYAAVKGMVDHLDPHSSFLPPKRYERLRQDTEGEFAGVGITLGEAPTGAHHPIVEALVPRSPAVRAGIAEADAVLAIDGKSTAVTEEHPVKARVWHSRLRGRSGTRVTLKVRRAGWKKARTFTLVREQVKVPTVRWLQLSPRIGYIAIKKFQEATSTDVLASLRALGDRPGGQRLSGLILDVRGNPGGLLDQAIRVVDLFIDKGLIVSIRSRAGAGEEREAAHGPGTWSGFPMIVLVDQGSASAAEIVAGALQDDKRATILGLPSYGKGSVQTFLDLADGSGLKLTTARYYTPKGRSLEGTGITPDVQVEAFEADDIVVGSPGKKRPGPGGSVDGGPETNEIGQMLADDLQLRTAYQMVRGWLGSKK